jgi:hypothetical protein
MQKKLQALVIVFALVAFFCGCATPTDPKAISLAVSQSNVETQRLYQVEPFKSEDGKLWKAGNHWVWDARTTADSHDYTSRVSFDRNGAVATVHVERH